MNLIEEHFRENRRRHVNAINKVVNNYATAEDIVQDAFVKAVYNERHYKPEKGPFKNWFSRVLYSVLADHLKIPILISIEDLRENEDGIDYTAIINELQSFYQTLDGLDQKTYYKIITLHYIKGYTQIGIAKLFDINLRTIQRICERFRQEIKT